MDMTYWEENSNLQRVKYEGCNVNEDTNRLKDDRTLFSCCDTNLNFSTATCSEDDSEFGTYKKNKVTRQDPMSHRIIEKRRRDRMNNCLADLSRLIPTEYLKKGRGRIEKTEIIEMAIKHMKYLQQEHGNPSEHYRLGYQECMSETMRFMVEVEGHFSHEAICVRLLNHLQKHCASICRGPAPSPQTVPSTNIHIMSPPQEIRDRVRPEYPTKIELENNNNNVHLPEPYTSMSVNGSPSVQRNEDMDHDHHDKHLESNGVSYKYKTNIKLRFNQDLNAEHDNKKQKTENGRRHSITSLENQSSSHSSPPSSETCRISETDNPHRSSPTESTISLNNNLKTEPIHRGETLAPYLSNRKHQIEAKNNFNVPIFVLHAKGSYYIPLTLDYKTLLPFLNNYDILESLPAVHNLVLHPVTINVNFQPQYANGAANFKYKSEYQNNGNWQ
uniref:BHLH transcription factor Hey n=1 Tax=Dastarcus helophoroides TaxID=1169899 RepID=A0A0U3A4D7_9CUCU|nr:bHLH transcription factor Hey [Dastarcus helophoroides]